MIFSTLRLLNLHVQFLVSLYIFVVPYSTGETSLYLCVAHVYIYHVIKVNMMYRPIITPDDKAN